MIFRNLNFPFFETSLQYMLGRLKYPPWSGCHIRPEDYHDDTDDIDFFDDDDDNDNDET